MLRKKKKKKEKIARKKREKRNGGHGGVAGTSYKSGKEQCFHLQRALHTPGQPEPKVGHRAAQTARWTSAAALVLTAESDDGKKGRKKNQRNKDSCAGK
jgi:hypothetical protein